jgi:hypothetical protein
MLEIFPDSKIVKMEIRTRVGHFESALGGRMPRIGRTLDELASEMFGKKVASRVAISTEAELIKEQLEKDRVKNRIVIIFPINSK